MDYKTFSSLSEDELWEKLMDGGIKIMMTAQEALDFGITDNSPLHEEVYSSDIKSIEEISEEEIERDCYGFREVWDSIPNARSKEDINI